MSPALRAYPEKAAPQPWDPRRPEASGTTRRGPWQIYLDANLALKEEILGKMESWNGTKTGRYRPEDSILKFLKEL